MKCGSPLAFSCEGCGAQNEPGSAFCEGCGKPITAGSAPVATAPVQAELAVAPDRSERRTVTVLFADISGFTTLSEELDPEEVTRMVNGAFEVLSSAVARLGGTVDKYIGDCIMALFGAPISHEDDPQRAVRCALEMRDGFGEYARKVGRDLGISIGLNTGPVLAGRVGGGQKQDYTVMGDTVNLAQRLQSKAGRGNIFVGSETFRLAEKDFQFEDVGEIPIKGKKEPVRCYKVVALARREPAGARRSLAPPTLVGRDRELAQLATAQGLLDGGRACVVSIMGDTGLGKTALRETFLSGVAQDRIQVLESECSSFLTESSYAVFRDVLKQILDLPDAPPADLVDERVKGLTAMGLSATEIELLAEVLVGVRESGTTRYLDPKARKDETFRAFLGLLRSLWRTTPTIVSIEDLQWMDDLSRGLLHLILRNLEGLPVLLFLTFRPEFEHSWANIPYYQQINLAPLPSEEIARLACAELAVPALDPSLGRFLVDKSEGNPLFLKEMLHILRDRGYLESHGGVMTLRGGIREVELPSGVRSIIGARLDQLPATSKRIVQYGAVIGRSFSMDVLNRLLPDPVAAGDIERLVDRDVLAPSPDVTGVFLFKHALVRDVAYQRTLREDATRMHREVAEIIETTAFWNLEDHLDILAHHFLSSGDHDRAFDYLERSGERMARNGANEAALRSFERAMEILPPHSDAYPERLARIRFELGSVLSMLGRPKEGEGHLLGALETAKEAGLLRLAPMIHLELGKIHQRRGQYTEAAAAFSNSFDLGQERGDAQVELESRRRLASIWIHKGNFAKALEELETELPKVKATEDLGLVARYLNDMGIAYNKLGRCEDALATYEESLRLKQNLGDRRAVEITLGNLAEVDMAMREHVRAEERLGQALKMAREIGDRMGVAVNLHNLGVLNYERGAFGQAQTQLAEALAVSEDLDWLEGKLLNPIYLARLKMIDGLPDEGYRELTDVLKQAQDLHETEAVATALYLLGEWYMEKGKQSEADVHLDEAMKLTRQMGHSLLEKRIHRLRGGRLDSAATVT